MASRDVSTYLTNLFSLADRTAIVTGATGGLGSAMTLALAKAGADIISIELPDDPGSADLDKALKEAGAKHTKFECDLRDAKGLRACFAKIWEMVGDSDETRQPDLLVNCAGVMKRNKCEDATDEEMDLMFDVNIKGVYVSMQEFGRRLLKLDRPGKIINVASVASFVGNVNTSVYSTSKGGVLQMTRAFSNEWSSRGIYVNAIAPGFMETPMTKDLFNNKEYQDKLMARVPAARWGQPQDMEGAVLFLASPASNYMTGAHIAVDGGYLAK